MWFPPQKTSEFVYGTLGRLSRINTQFALVKWTDTKNDTYKIANITDYK